MAFKFGLIGILIATQILCNYASSHVGSKGGAAKPTFLVTDYDFVNTNVKKVCMLALVDASVHLQNKLTGSLYTVKIPSDSSVEGSYCNRDFKSVLALKFADNVMKITFSRSHDETPRRGEMAYYCTDCNYGQWSIDEMAVTIQHNGTEVHAATVYQSMKDSFPPVLAGGITLRRSFRCQSSDAEMKIPLTVNELTNLTDGQHMSGEEDWKTEIEFKTMQFQPFLVGVPLRDREHTFSDPVLCRDVTASHVIVILLPIIYFAILTACYHIKRKYGCPVLKKKTTSKDTEDRGMKFITSDSLHSNDNETYKETKT